LEYQAFFPGGNDWYDHTVRLKKPDEFTIVIEASDNTIYRTQIEIQEGYRYSIYYAYYGGKNGFFIQSEKQ
jgi:hypothetical protein